MEKGRTRYRPEVLLLNGKSVYNSPGDKKSAEKGVKYDDPFLNIDWQLSKDEMIISKKDLSLSNYRW